MKKRKSLFNFLLIGCFCAVAFYGCTNRISTGARTPITSGNRGTVVGHIILGYGDYSPVANLPLWLGTESRGEPVTRTDADGKFVLTDLPIGQSVDVVDDHLFFKVRATSGGVTDVGIFEYPLIHP